VLTTHSGSLGWWDDDHLFYAQSDGLYLYDLNARRDQRIATVPDVCRGRGLSCNSSEVQPR
jgi:hypothetical protein